VNIAADHLGDSPYLRPFPRTPWQEWRLGIAFLKIFQDGKRLGKDTAVFEREGGHEPLRIDGKEGRVAMFPTIFDQFDGEPVRMKPLKGKADPQAIRG